MLQELENTSQIPGEGLRRWFSDSSMDLIIWEDENGNVRKFQLCYGKGVDEHAFTWRNSNSYTHNRVDDGEDVNMGHKNSPILVPDGKFNPAELAQKFFANSHEIDSKISEFVRRELSSCTQ